MRCGVLESRSGRVPDRTGGESTIAAALVAAARPLARAGIVHPEREARALWAGVAGAGVTPGDVWLGRERSAAPAIWRRFREAVDRRLSGVPFAYAVGRTSFRTLELKCDRRALIPRPETEGLVELVLRETVMRDGRCKMRGTVVDIGTGCGCIALSLAVEGRFERVIAVERSADAAALARENVALVRPPVPVDVRVGDLLAPLRSGERYRAIVSNPPYLTEAEYAALEPAVRMHEPREALVSGADGLGATAALLAGARPLLEPGGCLALEIDERRADTVCALARRHGWTALTVHHDLFGRPRYALACLEEDA